MGDGAHAAEVEDYSPQVTVLFNAVPTRFHRAGRARLIDIDRPSEVLRGTPVVAAVGAPGLKRDLVSQWSGVEYATIRSSESWVSSSALVGEGSVIAPLAGVSARTVIGRHVLINISATISHDCVIGDYVTVSPGAHIAGNVRIGDGVFIGIGAVISTGVSIADGAIIAAGAVLVRDAAQRGTYVGVPARLTRTNESWASVI